MKRKLLLDEFHIQVGKAKDLGYFCDSGGYPIDDDEIVIVIPDEHVVTDSMGEEEYHYSVPVVTKQIHSFKEIEEFTEDYCCTWDNIEEDSIVYYKYKASAKGPEIICRDEYELIDAYERADHRCKFIVTPYRID